MSDPRITNGVDLKTYYDTMKMLDKPHGATEPGPIPIRQSLASIAMSLHRIATVLEGSAYTGQTQHSPLHIQIDGGVQTWSQR